MYYEPSVTKHGLAFDPFKACVVPRPIGWISTLSSDGTSNLAPFSQFQNLSFDPPHVMFSASEGSAGARKDTIINIEESGEFVWNMATYDLREAVNLSAQELPPHVDEFEVAGLTKAPGRIVKAPLVADSPIHFECVHVQTIRLARGKTGSTGLSDLIVGKVVAVHIKDEFILPSGKIDILKIRPLARVGYLDYTTVDSIFEMVIPGGNKKVISGLAGNLAGFDN